MTASALRAWSWVHKWSSLIATAFLLLLCVTGLPLIFHEEIEHAFEPPPRPTGAVVLPTQPGAAPSLDDFAVHALAQGRGAYVNFVLLDRDEPRVRVGVSDSRRPAPGESHTFWFDRPSGAELEPPPPAGGFMEVMLRLHTDLYAGLPGTLFLGAMGLLLAVALISGVVLYAPFMRKLRFGTVRRAHAPATRRLDLHNLLGVATLVWLTIVGLTGTINALEIPLGQLWRSGHLLPMLQRHAGSGEAVALAPLSRVLASVREAAPGTEPASIIFPGMQVSGPHHYLVIVHGDRPATRQLIRAALVDAESGRLTDHAAMPWYVQTLSLSQPLHFGDYGGLPLKLLWAALDVLAIVVLITGLQLWLRKPLRAT